MSEQDARPAGEGKSALHLLREERAAKIAGLGPKVRELVLGLQVEAELTKRKDATLKLLDKIEAAQRELGKLKGSGEKKFALSGEVVGEPTFTKAQLEEIKKAEEQLQKLNSALDLAFGEKGDFKKLLELVQ